MAESESKLFLPVRHEILVWADVSKGSGLASGFTHRLLDLFPDKFQGLIGVGAKGVAGEHPRLGQLVESTCQTTVLPPKPGEVFRIGRCETRGLQQVSAPLEHLIAIHEGNPGSIEERDLELDVVREFLKKK
jgi:hypothetical protein